MGKLGQSWNGLTWLSQKGRGWEKLDYIDHFAVFKSGLAQFWNFLGKSST